MVQTALDGKRFGLLGFEREEAELIITALQSSRAEGHVVAPTPNIPALNSLSPFYACFVNASARVQEGAPSPIEMISGKRKAAVIVGDSADIVKHAAALADSYRDFALRPLNIDELMVRMSRVVQFAAVRAEAPNVTGSSTGRPVVLVADDDRTTAILVTSILKQGGFDCEIAHDGAEALERIRNKRPDVALLDISMPLMDGFETLAAMRKSPQTRTVPTLLLTARHSEPEVVKGFELGADDYITKPFSSGELIARINRLVRVANGS